MLVDEWALLVGVTFDTDRVPAWHGPDLAKSGGAVDVMAVAALNKAFVYSMVIWLREVGLRSCMTAVAEVRLRSNEEMLRFFGVMWRVAVQASDIIARVNRCREVPLLMFSRMAT